MKKIYTFFVIFAITILFSPLASFAQYQTEFWGMTNDAANGGGVIFKTDANGSNQQIMRTFVQVPGQNPDFTQLCQATNGKMYGMTYQGGMNNYGILFEYDPTTNTYTKKLDFAGTSNGAYPHGSLIKAANGKLYGMTNQGGANWVGALFEYDPSTNIYTKKLDFAGTANGSYPYGSLIQAGNGKFYGMTSQGGANGFGVLFEYDPSTSVYTKKVDFAGSTSGSYPYGSLIQAANGKLYGMTRQGGGSGNGVLFEYDLATSTYVKKIDFAGTSNGSYPYGSLIQASNSKLYGMTYYGGTGGQGVLFEYDPSSSTYAKKLDFAGTTNGSYPQGALFQAKNGKLYGMTSYGGASNLGIMFEYEPVTSTFIKRVTFTGALNGSRPYGSLMQATNGKLYGMTYNGGENNQGVLFDYDTTTNTYTKRLDFLAGSINGCFPQGSLLKASNNKFYGLASQGGTNGTGVLFEYDPATGTYTKKVDFTGTNGSTPRGSLVQASNGKLYGMTYSGGTAGLGVLFEYDPATNTYSKMLDFAGTTSGSYPYGTLVQAANGLLYGMTNQGGTAGYGVIFEFDPSTSTYIKKMEFAGTTTGSYPRGSFLAVKNGKLYGMTAQGGTNNYGVLFVYNPVNNSYTKKLDFSYTANGCYPYGNLIQANNGKLYGLTYYGGASGNGVLFNFDTTTNTVTKELDFAGTTNGGYPYGTLLQATNGKLYGMTYQGGVNNSGVIIQFDPTTSSFTKKLDFNGANGKNPYYTQLIEICVYPKFTSSIPDASVCPGGNTDFITSASGNGLSYQWQVDIGTGFSNLSNGSNYADVTDDTLHVIGATTGMNAYKYRCIVTSKCPVISIQSDTALLNVSAKPIPSFTINNNSQCLTGNNFGFKNTSTGATTYLWNFGNGDTSTTKFPSHSYLTAGSYTVKLIAMLGSSCKDSTTQTLDVRPQPVSSFTINNNSQCLSGNNFYFTNTSTGASTALWNFGDATATTTIISPTHSYASVGSYTIKLISTTTYGCKDSTTKTVDIRPQPVASFTINNNSQCLSGNNFSFTNTSTGATAALWNFGDATATSTIINPSHSYLSSGSFTVKLISTTAYGCKDSTTSSIDVRPLPGSNFTINNSSQCLSGNNFIFTNTTPASSNYLWNFGDATTSTASSPSHSYTTVGTYNVKLVSTTSYGCKDSITKTVNISPKSTSSFTINNNSQCLSGNNFVFTNTSTGASTYLWNFGDATSSSATSPSHSYSSSGAYTVKLVSMAGLGCKDSTTLTLNVRPQPVSTFKINNDIQCISGNNFIFTNTSTGSTTYLWNFGDATATSTTLSPSHSYTVVGTFTVKLVSATTYGCKDSASNTVETKAKPVTSFTINNNSQCLNGNDFIFTNTSTGASSCMWYFGDAKTSTLTSPSHSYTSSGSYTVKLVSMAGIGCKDSTTKTIDVRPKPATSFTVNNNSQCLKTNNFIFTNTTTGASSYIWNFGDATATTTVISPSHSYSKGGIYAVILYATSAYGCKDSNTVNITVKAPKPYLGKDTTIWGVNQLILDAGAGFDTYLWSNYSNTRTITVSSTKNGFGIKTFWVKVTQAGCEGYDTIKVTINKDNSIADPKESFEFRLYPNPVSSAINIELSPVRKEVIVKITDVNGKELRSNRIKPQNIPTYHHIDISEFAAGVYYLDISNAELRKVVKIMKY